MALVGCLAILFEAHASEETQPKEGGKEKLFKVYQNSKTKIKKGNSQVSLHPRTANACSNSTVPDAHSDSATRRTGFFPVMPCSFSRSASSQAVLIAARFHQREIFTLQVVQFFFTIAPNTISWGPRIRERIYHAKS